MSSCRVIGSVSSDWSETSDSAGRKPSVKDVGEPGDREGHARIDGGWLETGARPWPRRCAPVSETPGICAVTYRQSAPRQPPTLLRRFGNGDQMAQIDRYVRLRLALFVSK